MIATSFAVLALVAQPLVALNVPSAFALGGNVSVCAAGCDSTTIQGGIDMANAGDTVTVSAGTYNEDISITKNIILSGAGSSTTTLNGQGTVDYAINITGGAAGGTSISGFHIVAAVGKVGLKVDKTGIDQFGVTNNIFSGGRQLVYVGGTTNSTFTGNTFNVAGNTVASVYEAGEPSNGTGAVNPTANTWSGNTFVGSTTQLAFGSEASNSAFTNNNLTGLNVSIKDKIVEYSGTNNTGSGNTFNSAQPAISVYDDGTNYKGTFATVDKALSKVTDGDMIALESDITTTKQITLDKDNVTFDGQGHTITPTFTKTSGSNNAALGIINASNVHVRQLTIDGAHGTQLHGINVYGSNVPELWRVNINNSDRYALVIGNNSWVQGIDLHTSNNARNSVTTDNWTAAGAVNIDANSTFQDAGMNEHSESNSFTKNGLTKPLPALYIDSGVNGVVTDTNNQYVEVDNYWAQGDRAYFWKVQAPTTPSVISPLDGTYITSSALDRVEWGVSADGLSTPANQMKYEYRLYMVDPVANPGATIRYQRDFIGQTFNPAQNTPQGTYWWRVRACNPIGLCSGWTAAQKFTVDNTAPSVPTITAPGSRTWHRNAPILNSWTPVTDTSGISHYQIAYNYDDGHSFGGSTCPGLTMTGYSGFIGCRNLAGTSRNHSPALGEEGGVTIWVRAFDAAGNASPWSRSVHYYYDHTAPQTNIVAPTGIVGNAFTVSGDASDNEALNRVYVQLNKREGGRFGGTTINLITNPFSLTNHWSHTFDANALGLADGDYRAHVSVTDMAGNSSTAGWTDYFTIDTTSPLAPTATFALNADGTQAVTLNAETGASVYYTIDGSIPTIGSTPYNSTFDIAPVVAPATPLTIKAIAVDAAGNVSPVYTVAGPSITNQASQTATTSSITLVWTTGTPATSRVVYDTVPHATLGSDANYGYAFSTVEDTTKTTSHSVTITGLTPGTTYYFRVVSHGSPTTVSPEITSLTLNEQLTRQNGTPTFQVNTPRGDGIVAVAQNGDGAVLGTETGADNNAQNDPDTNTTSDKDVKGAEDVKGDDATSPLGVAWYWWVLALAAVATGIWWLIAARKRRKDEDK